MPLTRKTPLKRKTAMKRVSFKRTHEHKDSRPAFTGRARISDPTFYMGRKQPMRKVSKKQVKRLRAYYPAQEAFLKRPENRYCLVCLCRSLRQDVGSVRIIMAFNEHDSDLALHSLAAVMTPATEVHHWAGRNGALLTYEPYFIPSCFGCREWPHAMTKRARALDLLCPASLWNVVPPEARNKSS